MTLQRATNWRGADDGANNLWALAHPATPGAWPKRRRTWSITSFRRYRCGSGCSPCPNGCATSFSPTRPCKARSSPLIYPNRLPSRYSASAWRGLDSTDARKPDLSSTHTDPLRRVCRLWACVELPDLKATKCNHDSPELAELGQSSYPVQRSHIH